MKNAFPSTQEADGGCVGTAGAHFGAHAGADLVFHVMSGTLGQVMDLPHERISERAKEQFDEVFS